MRRIADACTFDRRKACLNNAYLCRSLLALWSEFHFESNSLTLLWATTQAIEGFDVHKYFLAALRWFDETETSIVVPGFDDSLKAHDGIEFPD